MKTTWIRIPEKYARRHPKYGREWWPFYWVALALLVVIIVASYYQYSNAQLNVQRYGTEYPEWLFILAWQPWASIALAVASLVALLRTMRAFPVLLTTTVAISCSCAVILVLTDFSPVDAGTNNRLLIYLALGAACVVYVWCSTNARITFRHEVTLPGMVDSARDMTEARSASVPEVTADLPDMPHPLAIAAAASLPATHQYGHGEPADFGASGFLSSDLLFDSVMSGGDVLDSIALDSKDPVVRAAFLRAMYEVRTDATLVREARWEASDNQFTYSRVRYAQNRTVELIPKMREALAKHRVMIAEREHRGAVLGLPGLLAWESFMRGDDVAEHALSAVVPLLDAAGMSLRQRNARQQSLLDFALGCGWTRLACELLKRGMVPSPIIGGQSLGAWGTKQAPAMANLVTSEAIPALDRWMASQNELETLLSTFRKLVRDEDVASEALVAMYDFIHGSNWCGTPRASFLNDLEEGESKAKLLMLRWLCGEIVAIESGTQEGVRIWRPIVREVREVKDDFVPRGRVM